MATIDIIKGGSRAPIAVAVFIHGLNGDKYETWQDGSESDNFWPRWLLDDISGLRSITVGYDTSATDWHSASMPLTDRAANIAAQLLTDKLLLRNSIIFIVHSLGGLLLKQIVRHLESQCDIDPNAKVIIENTKLVIFMGTPHFGSRIATFGEKISSLFRPSSLSRSLVYEDHNLRDLNSWYRRYVNGRIRHVIISETKGSKVLGKIVDQVSSDPGIPDAKIIPVDADHTSICKPATRDSEIYKLVKFEVELVVRSTMEILQARENQNKGLIEPIDTKSPKELMSERLSKHRGALATSAISESFTILLCGPSSARPGDTAGARLRSRLHTLLLEDGFNVVVGEDDGIANNDLAKHNNSIVGEIEFIKSHCNAVIIIADTIGTWCEVGLFGWQLTKEASFRRRGIDLIVLVSEEHSEGNRFFRAGPFALVNAFGKAEFVSMDSYNADGMLERLRSRRLIYTGRRRRKNRAVS